jgi:DNA replication factor GINS
MYNELYEIWKRELENSEIEKLPPDFYSRIADYLRNLREEERMLDKKTIKARLLKSETQNVKRMIRELIQVRYRKIIRVVAKGEKVSSDVLAVEEREISTGILPFAESFEKFVKDIMSGYIPKVDAKLEHKRIVLRFLMAVPTIIGADMKTYGPFKVEDVASLPGENARILIKQGLAEKVEVNQFRR